MPRTREQIEAAAADAAAWLDSLDPETTRAEDISDLRAIADAVDGLAGAQLKVENAVAAARANGRSWGRIGIVLGISRQSARERYDSSVNR